MISLFNDQEEFISSIRSVWRENKRIVGFLPTGGGKTRCAARIIEGMTSKGMRVYFTVPRISLIKQTLDSFTNLGLLSVTVLHRDYDFNPSANIVITTQQTLTRRGHPDCDLIIIDEAHKRSKIILDWMDERPEQRYIGLTATPFPDWMGKYYTALAKGRSMRWLIDNGRLSDYDVYAPDIPDTSNCKTKKDQDGVREFEEGEIAAIMGEAKIVGNVVDNWINNGGDEQTIALAVNVMHANQLANEFERLGVSVAVITAKTPLEEREVYYSRYRSKVIRILLSVDCLTEGADFPECTVLINARPTKSKCRYIQGMGRVLRFIEGKRAKIFDHSGTTLDLGLPCSIEIDGLASENDGKSQQQNFIEKEEKEKKPKKCSKCDFIKPAGIHKCPNCGATPRAGEDVEALEDIGLKKIKGEKKTFTKEEKQNYYSELLGWQVMKRNEGKNYNDGFIARVYKDKFGAWPKSLDKKPKAPSEEVQLKMRKKLQDFARRKSYANKAK